MQQRIVESITGEHKCFCCREVFKYQISLNTGKLNHSSVYQVISVGARIANYAYIGANLIEVDAFCTNCENNNRFKFEVK